MIKNKYQICDLKDWSFLFLKLASLCNPRQTKHHFTVLANSSSSSQLTDGRLVCINVETRLRISLWEFSVASWYFLQLCTNVFLMGNGDLFQAILV